MAILSLNEVRTEQIKNIANDNFESWPESATYGYFGGGTSPTAVPSIFCTIDRIDFSNETRSAPGNDLTQARRRVATSFNNNYGYFAGGGPPPYTSIMDRLDFSN